MAYAMAKEKRYLENLSRNVYIINSSSIKKSMLLLY